MAQRKKWATSFPSIPGDERKRHPSSQAAAYRYVRERAGMVDRLRSPLLIVWVDDPAMGPSWSVFDRIDLRDIKVEAQS